MEMNKERVLVLGRGFLGREFEKHGYTVWGRDKFDYDRTLDSIYKVVPSLDEYDVIINCIGCADTRGCEDPSQWSDIFNTNAELARILSRFCGGGKKFVHISSGCVYDKNNEPQTEESFTASHCRYVVSKLAGEYYCDPTKDLILRPRLYFGEDENKNNLLCKIPKFDRHLTEMNSFTSVQTIVEATTALLEAEQVGVFNVAQTGYANIKQIAQVVGLPEKPTISGSELQIDQGLALVNNILDTTKLEQFYTPRDIFWEIERCWEKLYN